MADDDRACWYPLDGTWHKSVASKMSALHLKYSSMGEARCNTDLLLFDDDAYTEAEAEAAGRTLCKSCLKLRDTAKPRQSSTSHASK